jgi:hypothetical protein
MPFRAVCLGHLGGHRAATPARCSIGAVGELDAQFEHLAEHSICAIWRWCTSSRRSGTGYVTLRGSSIVRSVCLGFSVRRGVLVRFSYGCVIRGCAT